MSEMQGSDDVPHDVSQQAGPDAPCIMLAKTAVAFKRPPPAGSPRTATDRGSGWPVIPEARYRFYDRKPAVVDVREEVLDGLRRQSVVGNRAKSAYVIVPGYATA